MHTERSLSLVRSRFHFRFAIVYHPTNEQQSYGMYSRFHFRMMKTAATDKLHLLSLFWIQICIDYPKEIYTEERNLLPAFFIRLFGFCTKYDRCSNINVPFLLHSFYSSSMEINRMEYPYSACRQINWFTIKWETTRYQRFIRMDTSNCSDLVYGNEHLLSKTKPK